MRRAYREPPQRGNRAELLRRVVLASAFVSTPWVESFASEPLPSSSQATPAPVSAPPGTSAEPYGSVAPEPLVWGDFALTGYAAGTHEAANGLAFDPLFALSSNLNLGLVPDNRVYLVFDEDYWLQRTAARDRGVDQREFDVDAGLAWNYFDALEFRASAYALNNLNRGLSPARPRDFLDGIALENRYYFGDSDKYDVGRRDFVGLGYSPTRSLLNGNDGRLFYPGLFAQGYATWDLPISVPSYVYGGLKLIDARPATPQLLDSDIGLALRPFNDFQNLEFRIGYDRLDDLHANTSRNLIYGSLRVAFRAGEETLDRPSTDTGGWQWAWPSLWGVVGLPVYAAGAHMAPNGMSFTPIFGLTTDLNLGLLPQKELYLFQQGNIWAQRAAPGVTNSGQGALDFSKRELDSELGVAWNYLANFELRGSVYALDNLNRGLSLSGSSDDKEGVKLENRYYFAGDDPYDLGRLSFVSIGSIPAGRLIGGNGSSFSPGMFARGYVTRDLPIPWIPAYVYGGLSVTAQAAVNPRLVDTDAGLAFRPFETLRAFEFRVGYSRSDDLRAGQGRDFVYTAVRYEFGLSQTPAR